jgi:hypothetical protein
MPIGTSDGKYYEDEFDFFTNNGKEVIDPKTVMPPASDPKIDEIHPDMMDPSLPKMDDYEMSAQRRSQDASIGHTEPRTDVLVNPEVPNPTPDELNASGRGVLNKLTGADGQERYKLWPERAVEEVLNNVRTFMTTEPGSEENIEASIRTAFDLGSGGLATAGLRPNSAGIFGGLLGLSKQGKDIPEMMKRLEKSLPETEITRLTGMWKGAEGKWRFEIPDKDAKLDKEAIEDLVKAPLKGNLLLSHNLEDVLKHDQLYEVYPQLKKVLVQYHADGPSGAPDAIAAYYRDYNIIAVGPEFIKLNTADRTAVMLHEIQHGVQKIEGFIPGASPSQSKYGRKAAQIDPLLQKAVEKFHKEKDSYTPVERNRYIHEINDLNRTLQYLKDKAHEEYWNSAGEKEAREVEKAYYKAINILSPEERGKAVEAFQSFINSKIPKDPNVPRGRDFT